MDFDWLIAIIAAYLCGSIPFGLLIGFAHGVDLRARGSRNIGATNCGRVVGGKWGYLCFTLDVLKGAAPVAVAGGWFGWLNAPEVTAAEAWRWLAIAVAPVLGHVGPVWLKFRGGKGVATGFGVIVGVWPFLTVPAAAAMATWAVIALAYRYVSLASIASSVGLPIYFLVTAAMAGWTLDWAWPFVAVTAAMAALVVYRHRTNIARLRTGEETKIGDG